MLKVSEELLATRTESRRVLQQELTHGAAPQLPSGPGPSRRKFDAKAVLLQSQLDYTQAHDEITHAMGHAPE